jgi:hypothetical protein
MELPYSALHQLCVRMLHRLDRVPSPQRDALSVALGLQSGSTPDRFLVDLAVLGLLSDVAAEQPLLCLIDDAQWLDQTSAQALAFVARRLDTESVAVIFGTREPAGDDLSGLPELTLEGLSDADALVLRWQGSAQRRLRRANNPSSPVQHHLKKLAYHAPFSVRNHRRRRCQHPTRPQRCRYRHF